jgi:GntR family transcriptional regulator
MLIVVDPNSGVPVYRQVIDQIRFHVSTGLLEPGDELPSTRALSNQLGINPMTISKAYSFLERDGVVQRRPGRPLVVRAVEDTEVAARRTDQVREALAPAVRILRQLGVAPEEATTALEEMLRGGSDETSRNDGGKTSASDKTSDGEKTGGGGERLTRDPDSGDQK